MGDLKLKRLTVRNWMKLKENVIDFPESGLVLVVGVNSASRGALASVGSGKTAVGEAIVRTLLGVRGRFTDYKECSTDERGDTYVKLEADLRGQPLIIESGYKTKEFPDSPGEALRYTYGDKVGIQRSTLDETRAEIDAMLGINSDLAEWTVFIDGKKLDFSDSKRISQEDLVNLLMSALAQPPWTQYFDRSKKVFNQFTQAASTEQSKHAAALTKLQDAEEDLDSAKHDLEGERNVYTESLAKQDELKLQLHETIQLQRKEIEEAVARQESIKQRLKQIEDQRAEKQHQLEIERNALNDKIQDQQDARGPLLEARGTLRSAWSEASGKLSELESTPANCSTCGKPWDTKPTPEEIAAQKKKVEAAKKKYDGSGTKINALDESIRELRAKLQEVNKNIQTAGSAGPTKALSDEYEGEAETVKLANDTIHDCEVQLASMSNLNDSAVKAAEAVVKERERQVTVAKSGIEEAAKALSEVQATLGVVSYWNKAFSPTGIPNMVLAEAIPALNEVAKAVSVRMTGGTIQISFSTARELVTGKSKAKLVIKVNNTLGSKKLKGSSKGEGGLTNIVIAETLAEVGNIASRIGFRWYDEVLPNQDPVVAKSVYTHMREFAQRTGTLVFLVEHDPVAENFADHILVVEKRLTDSAISWKR